LIVTGPRTDQKEMSMRRGTQRLSAEGQSYTSEYVLTIMDPAGAVMGSIPGTATAVRITLESVTNPGTPAASPAA
jgi:hypothetical protein